MIGFALGINWKLHYMSNTKSQETPVMQAKKVECAVCGLSNLCIPHGLTVDELENLDSIVKTKRKLERDDILYHAGAEVTPIYAVSSGSFKTSVPLGISSMAFCDTGGSVRSS